MNARRVVTKRKLYCVWNNDTDALVALDENADTCSQLMGIEPRTFYSYVAGKPNKQWTIIKSKDIESEEMT